MLLPRDTLEQCRCSESGVEDSDVEGFFIFFSSYFDSAGDGR
jgi:hypothetical protein